MAYDHVTIMFSIDAGATLAQFAYSPSDVVSAGIYPDATVLVIDNEVSFEGKNTLYVLDGPYGSHNSYLASHVFESGVSASLPVAFGTAAAGGNWLYNGYPYHANNSIPIVARYTDASAPTSPKVAETLSRSATDLEWGAGSAGTNNSVTGYDVEYQESADGISWPDSWQTAAGSPVTGTQLSVFPPDTAGHFRRFRVRTRGSAGEGYYSSWVISTNVLRRKWDAFEWTDPVLTAGVSSIRAVHLTQLQERIDAIRPFFDLSAYDFTPVTAGVTKVAKWADLIAELRAAIDETGEIHDAWNLLKAGVPRIANIMQIRQIINGEQGGDEVPYVFVINGNGYLLCSSSTGDTPPFEINEDGELVYTYESGTQPPWMYIDENGYLILNTEG